MIRLLFLAALLWAGAAAAAETVKLRSGEHPSFSRLVVFLHGKQEWDVMQNGKTVDLRLSGPTKYDFDIEAVFERIPRTRIADVRQGDRNHLILELACLCEVTSFFQAPRMLVLDVADSVEINSAPVSIEPAALRIALQPELEDRASYSTASVQLFAEALAERTTRQILDIGMPESTQPARVNTTGVDSEDIRIPNIGLRNIGFSRASVNEQPGTHAGCGGLTDDPLGRFSNPGNFMQEKAAITARLYTERQDLNPSAALELAQLYLSRGLGAEARQAVLMTGLKSGETDFLLNLSEMIESPDSTRRADLEAYAQCAEINALWPILAAPKKPLADAEAWSVVRAAEALPRPLLRAVGSRLISNLVESDQKDPARTIARILERAGGASGNSIADVLLSDDAAEKDAILDQISRSNSEEAARASAILVEQRVQAGERIPSGMSELVASHAEEQRHGDAAGMLRKAEAFSLISRGEFDAALGILKSGELDDEDQAATIAQFFGELTRSGETVTFLKTALAENVLVSSAPAEVRQAVAARLYENRFSEAAAALVDANGAMDETLLANALGARFFGDVGIADEILFSASAGSDDQAAAARYSALLTTGRFVEAKQAAMRLGLADPVDALLALDTDESDIPTDVAEVEISLGQAQALSESTRVLTQTVAEVLGDPALSLVE